MLELVVQGKLGKKKNEPVFFLEWNHPQSDFQAHSLEIAQYWESIYL